MRMLALAAAAAIATTSLVMIGSGARSPAVAQKKEPAKCNELPPQQCIACAKKRGFKPEQYRPYCGA
jgi:hypothetical protein